MENKSKKICHLTTAHYPLDNRIFYKECLSLKKAGYDVIIIAPNSDDKIVKGVKILSIPKYQNLKKRLSITIFHILKKSFKVNADIYHFHEPELILVGLLLFFKNKRVIYDVHENYITSIEQREYLNNILKFILKKIFYVIENFASRFFEIILAEKYYAERFPQQITVLNYPKKDMFIKKVRHFPKNEFSLIYTGTITEDRGALIYADIAQKLDNINIYLIGKCSYNVANKIKKRANYNNNIQIIGLNRYIPYKEICNYLKQNRWLAGLAIFPETSHYVKKELTKFFEYMAVGLPIIYSAFPVWENLIDSNKAGISVNPNSIPDIINTIKWLVDNPLAAKKMGINGLKAVETFFNWENEEKKLLKLYKNNI
ncbi:MAG: glycosyltransferase [bacterium]